MRSLLILLLFNASFRCFSIESRDKLILENDLDERPLQVAIAPQYYSVNSGGATLTGVGISIGQIFNLSDDFGFGVQLLQAYTAEGGGSALYTDVGVRLRYAITGHLAYKARRILLDGIEVMRGHSSNPGGLRGEIMVHQYFFNTVQAAIPYSGYSANILYELPSEDRVAYVAGLGYGTASSGDKKVTVS